MLTIILYRCGLQLISDKKILDHPALKRVRLEGMIGTPPLFDLGLVHDAVHEPLLKESGRPDIVHDAIKVVTDSPFWVTNEVRLIVHTTEDAVWDINREWRVPANYFRFFWLMERFLQNLSLSFADQEMIFRKQTVPELLAEIEAEGRNLTVFLLSRVGTREGLPELVQILKRETDPVVIVGGYQKGTAIMELGEALAENYQVSSWKIASKGVLASTALSRLLFGLEFF